MPSNELARLQEQTCSRIGCVGTGMPEAGYPLLWVRNTSLLMAANAEGRREMSLLEFGEKIGLLLLMNELDYGT